jgi:methanol:N,N-dimethyl-4-nitrosoaniline oxidoreductase
MFEFPIKEFFKQPRSLLGAGAYENAGPEAAAMGLRHVLFVTSGLSGTGIIDECKTNFENAGVSVTVYDKVESNPKRTTTSWTPTRRSPRASVMGSSP